MSASLPAIWTPQPVHKHQPKMTALPSTTAMNGGSESPKPPLCWSSTCLASAAARSADCLLADRRRRRRTQVAQRNGGGCARSSSSSSSNGENPKDVSRPNRPQDVARQNNVDDNSMASYTVNESRIVVNDCGDLERRRLASSSGTSADESPTYRRMTAGINSRTGSLSSSSSDTTRGATRTRETKSKTLPGIKEVTSGENTHRQHHHHHHHHVVNASTCLPVFCIPFRSHARDAKQQVGVHCLLVCSDSSICRSAIQALAERQVRVASLSSTCH